MTKPFTIGMLFYGDHLPLAKRLLGSLTSAVAADAGLLREIRVGFNVVAPAVDGFVRRWLRQVHRDTGIATTLFFSDHNVFKYPLMRKMLYTADEHQPALGEFLTWFDDDSYLDGSVPAWWRLVAERMQFCDLLGQVWYMPVRGDRWKWVKQQPWYNPAVGQPVRAAGASPAFRFCTGGGWTARTEFLRRWNWPWPELKHNGGDSGLGELLRHQGGRIRHFDEGIRINADAGGRHSRAARRGYSELPLGTTFAEPGLAHQQFPLTIEPIQ